MKRMSRISCALALLLMSLGAARSASAVGLLGVGQPPATFKNSAGAVVTVPGLPAWFQDQNGVAVQPCLDPVPCALVGRLPAALGPLDPGFNPDLPLVYPDNFPDEAFYFAADVEFPVVGTVPGLLSGPFTAQFRVTQEFVFLDAAGSPTYPGAPVAVPAPFQRLRFIYFFNGINPTTVPGLISGDAPTEALATGTSFKLTTPWGDPTFNLQEALTNTKTPPDPTNMKCETAFTTGDTKCLFTRDIFSVPPDFAPALAGGILPATFGGNAMSTFLQDPLAAPGFIGSAAAAPLSFTGAPAGRANIFSVTDPMGNIGSSAKLPPLPQLKDLTGKKFGMEVAPLVFDSGAALPVTTPVTTSPETTITVTNPDTVNALTMGTLAFSGTNPADFTITANPCSGQILAAATVPFDPAQTTNKCTFAVAFAPKRLASAPEVAIRTAMVNIPGTYAGAAAPTRLVALSGTAQHTLAASADANGAISPVGAAILVSPGAAQNFTITPNPKFQVKDITVNGTPATFTKPANPTAAITFTTPAATTSGTTVNATFMPSGDLDGDGILDVKDALKALKILVGLFPAPTADDLVAMKVTPLDATGRPAGTGAPDLNDVVLILKRVLGIVTW